VPSEISGWIEPAGSAGLGPAKIKKGGPLRLEIQASNVGPFAYLRGEYVDARPRQQGDQKADQTAEENKGYRAPHQQPIAGSSDFIGSHHGCSRKISANLKGGGVIFFARAASLRNARYLG
jgi:hypothetical protein